jgi:hypothetical protein
MWRKDHIATGHSQTEANAPLLSMWELVSNEFPISLSESWDSTSGLDDWELALTPHSFIPLDTPQGSPFPDASTSTMVLVPLDSDLTPPTLIPESTQLKPKRLVSFLCMYNLKGPDAS